MNFTTPLKYVKGTTLFWVQPHMTQRRFELKSEDEVVATLEWKKLLGTLAEARSADGDWTFKREGFFHPRVTIRRAGDEENLAVFKPDPGDDGFVEFIDGRRFRWAHTDFWATKWALQEAEGGNIAEIAPSGHFKTMLSQEGTVEVSINRKDTKDLSLLIALGWYLMISLADDTIPNQPRV